MKPALKCIVLAAVGIAAALAAPALGQAPAPRQETTTVETPSQPDTSAKPLEAATFGGGCFWCLEAVYQQLKGVEKVVSGYSGGNVRNPTYKQVLTGLTGHAEVVQITYDPAIITYPELLEVFWKIHDPTTLNRQGPDIGTQYRSIILAHNPEQLELARSYKAKLSESGAFNRPIVTEIKPLSRFYPAEAYHQNYFRNNPYQGYCQYVIVPKLEKFQQVFRDKLKQ